MFAKKSVELGRVCTNFLLWLPFIFLRFFGAKINEGCELEVQANHKEVLFFKKTKQPRKLVVKWLDLPTRTDLFVFFVDFSNIFTFNPSHITNTHFPPC